MAKYQGTVTSDHREEEVWRYLADLRSIGEWDPSVEDVRLTAGEPGRVGARYELEVSFLGRTLTLPYETVAAEAPHLVRFEAETDMVSISDEATIEAIGSGVRATWSASLQLKGAGRILELPLRVAFTRLGNRAKNGLDRRLRTSDLTLERETTAG